MPSRLRSVVRICALAGALTYLSLLVPGRLTRVCGYIDEPTYCSALAYGFPALFLVDGSHTSPTGSVARDPLSLLIGLDDLLWERLGWSALFWLAVVLAARTAWHRWRRRRQAQQD